MKKDNLKEFFKKLKNDRKNRAILIEGIVIAILLGTTIGFTVSTVNKSNTLKEESSKVQLLTANIQELVNRIATLEDEKTTSEEELTSLQNELEELKTQYDSLEDNNATLEAQIIELNNQIATKTSTITALESQITTLTAQVAQLTALSETYTVFYVHGGEVLAERSVSKNGSVTESNIPSTPELTNKFVRWPTVSNVTSDKVVFLETKDASLTISTSAIPGHILYSEPCTEANELELTYTWYKVSDTNEESLITNSLDWYQVTSSDIGYKIKVEITASGYSGKGSVTSGKVTNPIEGEIYTSGAVAVKSEIECDYFLGNASSYKWQWYLDNVAISGATEDVYTPAVEDLNKNLKVEVIPTDGHDGTLVKDLGKIGKYVLQLSDFYWTGGPDYCYNQTAFIDGLTDSIDKMADIEWYVGGVLTSETSESFIINDTSYIGKSLSAKLTGKGYCTGEVTIPLTDEIQEAELEGDFSTSCSEGVIEATFTPYSSHDNFNTSIYVNGTNVSDTNIYIISAEDIGKEYYAEVEGTTPYTGTITSDSNIVTYTIKSDDFEIDFDDMTGGLMFTEVMTDLYTLCTVTWECEGDVLSTDRAFIISNAYDNQYVTLRIVGDGTYVKGEYVEQIQIRFPV